MLLALEFEAHQYPGPVIASRRRLKDPPEADLLELYEPCDRKIEQACITFCSCEVGKPNDDEQYRGRARLGVSN